MKLFFTLILGLFSALHANDDFWQHWGDGKAELSTYKLKTPRYGEIREGHAVFIFVTENISRTTRIKVESKRVPKNDRVPVLKLNRIEKFTTGIYDYSLMTSVFSAVEKEQGNAYLSPMKISFTSQDWCGHLFSMLLPLGNSAEFTQNSYFEAEGDQKLKIELPQNVMYEDNFPIWIRELRGQNLAKGASRTVKIIPRMWDLRRRHSEIAVVDAAVKKEPGSAMQLEGKKVATWKWTLKIGDRSETFWVEQLYPRRIVKFQSSDGTVGELLETRRLPYWSLHDRKHDYLRAEFKLNHGFTSGVYRF